MGDWIIFSIWHTRACTHAFECLYLSIERGFRRALAGVEMGCLFMTTKIGDLLEEGWVVVVVDFFFVFVVVCFVLIKKFKKIMAFFRMSFNFSLQLKYSGFIFLLCCYSYAAETKQATAQRIAPHVIKCILWQSS